jgi:hypothetical protein
MNYKQITFVGAIHGNETAPYFAACEAGVPIVCGNPRAAFERKRYVERDLNASFGTKGGETLEERRARELLKILPVGGPVVDFHTFSCVSEPFTVIVDRAQLPLAALVGIRKVVLMSYSIKSGHALINHRPGVSPEVGQHDSILARETTLQVIKSIRMGKPRAEIELYEVYGVIPERGDHQNFIPHRDGFIPVLAGEQAYTHGGLKARRIDK